MSVLKKINESKKDKLLKDVLNNTRFAGSTDN